MANILNQIQIDTPLGLMVAVASDEALYFLEFGDCDQLSWQIALLEARTQKSISPASNPILQSINKELHQYFKGSLKKFETPFQMLGTPFQMRVWGELCKIPYGTTLSYAQLAKAIGQPKASRAVGSANGRNQLTIIIPCHRVIAADGTIGGYNGGLERKLELLKVENCHVK